MIRPPRISPGARVAIVAPSSSPPRDELEAGAKILGARYRLVHDERIFHKRGFLAGSDEDRRAELQRALDDDDVLAIFAARGGYGLMRILPSLDGSRFARAPKLLVGFSDVTALQSWAAKLGVASVHGPVVTQLGKIAPADVDSLWPLLESPSPPPPIEGLTTIVPGRAEGRLAGGNLEMISRLAGTPWALELDGAILAIEEIGERPYRIDRALTQLILGGALARVRGVVVGGLVDCGKAGDDPSAAAVVAERLSTLGIPVAGDAPIGHGERNRAIPLGARVELDASAGRLEFREGAVE